MDNLLKLLAPACIIKSCLLRRGRSMRNWAETRAKSLGCGFNKPVAQADDRVRKRIRGSARAQRNCWVVIRTLDLLLAVFIEV